MHNGTTARYHDFLTDACTPGCRTKSRRSPFRACEPGSDAVSKDRWRTLRKEDRREQILAVLCLVFAEKGYRLATISKVVGK